MNVNETLRKLRESRHLQSADVANAIGMSRQGYNNYETGSRNPSLDTIVKLAKFYNVSTDYILGVSDLNDDSLITKNNIKMTDEKAEKLLQSFLQLPDSIKVGVMQWLESTITVLDTEVKPLTHNQLQLIESYKNQDSTIIQSNPPIQQQPVQSQVVQSSPQSQLQQPIQQFNPQSQISSQKSDIQILKNSEVAAARSRNGEYKPLPTDEQMESFEEVKPGMI